MYTESVWRNAKAKYIWYIKIDIDQIFSFHTAQVRLNAVQMVCKTFKKNSSHVFLTIFANICKYCHWCLVTEFKLCAFHLATNSKKSDNSTPDGLVYKPLHLLEMN